MTSSSFLSRLSYHLLLIDYPKILLSFHLFSSPFSFLFSFIIQQVRSTSCSRHLWLPTCSLILTLLPDQTSKTTYRRRLQSLTLWNLQSVPLGPSSHRSSTHLSTDYHRIVPFPPILRCCVAQFYSTQLFSSFPPFSTTFANPTNDSSLSPDGTNPRAPFAYYLFNVSITLHRTILQQLHLPSIASFRARTRQRRIAIFHALSTIMPTSLDSSRPIMAPSVRCSCPR